MRRRRRRRRRAAELYELLVFLTDYRSSGVISGVPVRSFGCPRGKRKNKV